MPVTMKDIAMKTGVSIGTVDRALNNRGRINPEVAERIRKVAEDLHYKPNSVAKSLAIRNKKLKIAIVLHIQRNNNYYEEVEAGIREAEQEIQDFGIQLVFYRSIGFDPVDQLRQLDLAVANGASAIVLVPIDSEPIRTKVEQLRQDGIPVVFLSNFMNQVSVFASVHCDYYRSGQMAAGLLRLLAKEPGDVLVFSNSFSMLGHRRRVAGLQDQLALSCPDLTIKKIIELPNSELDTYQLVKSALADHPCRYLVYSGNPKAGITAIQEASQKTSSIFYDLSSVSRQALLSGVIDAVIFQNPRQQGYRAVNLLFEYLTADKIPPQKVELVECNIILKENLYAL